MLLILISLCVLFHQFHVFCFYGERPLTSPFLPALGLSLPRTSKRAIKLALCALCGLMAAGKGHSLGIYGLFILLSLDMASDSWRLSNHLVVAWFMLLSVLCEYSLGAIVRVGTRSTIELRSKGWSFKSTASPHSTS